MSGTLTLQTTLNAFQVGLLHVHGLLLLRRTPKSVTEQVTKCADIGLQLQIGHCILCETRSGLPISCIKKPKKNFAVFG